MSFSLKLQKEIEADLHEQLYTNIFILTLNYPTSKDFDAHFKRNMFVKSNKAGFHHVTHFLINILNPNFFSKCGPLWPILDSKMEVKFRNEIIKYLTELTSNNKESGIPLIMTSHLISPGGYKFAEFIFRLSQFVLLEHIKREEIFDDNIILPPSANTDYNIASSQINDINKILDTQYSKLLDSFHLFLYKCEKSKEQINLIIEENPALEQQVQDLEEKIQELMSKSNDEIYNIYKINLEDCEKQMEEKFDELIYYNSQIQKCSELFDIINEEKNIIKHSPELLEDNTNESGKIDLIDHFKSLLEILKKNKYIFQTRKNYNLSEYVEVSNEIVKSLREYLQKYEELLKEYREFQIELEENTEVASKQNFENKEIREIFAPDPPVNINLNHQSF